MMEGKIMETQWRLAKGKVPEYEVLAVGYQDEMWIGFLHKDAEKWQCENDSGILDSVRYYIPMKDLRKTIPKEAK